MTARNRINTFNSFMHWLAVAVLFAGQEVGATAVGNDGLDLARENMIRVIELHARVDMDIADRLPIGQPVLDVMAEVPRHDFVAEDMRSVAYEDRPPPIGHGQTISQPFIVALMTEMLQLEPDDVVLEIGTGSGYQAATLDALGYDNIETYAGDGYFSVPEATPFDSIMVTAAASNVPPPLIEQLKPGARMIIPVGGSFAFQYLMIVEKDADGHVTTRQTLPVSFVPLTRGD